MMGGTIRHIINMANSIIGVSILSMPYCFKETGLVLGVFLILFSGFITKKTCMFLIRAAIMSRRRSYELLAFQVFGVTGKLLMELCMILFLIGICISFHVVMGDLAPSIMAKYMAVENSPSLRCTLLVGMVVLVILPLCLLRNLDSLASMSACSIGFYIFLNCIIFYMALPNLLDGTWIQKAQLFQFDSIFRVLPIMTLALACQSNVFEIYESIPDPDVMKMKSVVSQAVNICCALYIGVGFMGYVAFVDRDIGGNVIMSFPVSKLTDGIIVFFVFSLAISFPLILFPCRTSIHSLLYKRNTQMSYDIVGNYMPESRFKAITITVLTVSLIIGIMLPNIEFVLGLLGSTMGVIIALVLPSVFYIRVYTKTSCDRLLAQGFFLLGVILMVTGTYLHLSGMQNSKQTVTMAPVLGHSQELLKSDPAKEVLKAPVEVDENEAAKILSVDITGRKEPAIPEPPPNPEKDPPKMKDLPEEDAKDIVKKSLDLPNVIPPPPDPKDKKPEGEKEISKPSAKADDLVGMKKEEDLHPDAIKKEEKENAEEAQGKVSQQQQQDSKENLEKKQEEILKQMESQQKEQKMLIEEQKKILQELKDQKEKVEMENEAEEAKDEGDAAGPEVTAPRKEMRAAALPRRQNIVGGENEGREISLISKNEPYQDLQKRDQVSAQAGYPDLRKPLVPQEESLAPNPKEASVNQIPVVREDVKLSNTRNGEAETLPKQAIGNTNLNPGQPNSNDGHNLPLNSLLSNKAIDAPRVQDLPVAKPRHDLVENPSLNKELHNDQLVRNLVFPKDNSGLRRSKQGYKPGQLAQPAQVVRQAAAAGAGLGIVGKRQIEPEREANLNSNAANKIPPGDQGLKHDEERRKRDLLPPDDLSRNRDSEEGTLIQHSDRLSFDSGLKTLKRDRITKDTEQKVAADVNYDTRHLLWVGRSTRRKKRRQEQFPNYWDEM